MDTKDTTESLHSNIGLAVGGAALGLLASALPAQAQLNRAPYL